MRGPRIICQWNGDRQATEILQCDKDRNITLLASTTLGREETLRSISLTHPGVPIDVRPGAFRMVLAVQEVEQDDHGGFTVVGEANGRRVKLRGHYDDEGAE